MAQESSALRMAADRLAAEREGLVRAMTEALRPLTTVSAAEAARRCESEATAIVEALRGGDLAAALERDEAAFLAGRTRRGLLESAAEVLIGLECAAPILLELESPAGEEALRAVLQGARRRLEALLRLGEEESGRRLAEAQDQAARANERAAAAFHENEALRKAEERSRHRAEQLALLGTVTHRVAGILDPDRLMEEAAAAIQARMDHTFVAVVVVDEEGVLKGRWAGRPGVSRESAGRAKGPIQGIIGRALRKRAPQIVGDVSRDADYYADVPGTRSEMVVPLMSAGDAVGALDFQSERPDAFDLDDVVAGEILAEFLVVALRNARLYAERGEA